MKSRLQITSAFAGPLVCALLWFALWLVPFHPTPMRDIRPALCFPVTFQPNAAESLRDLRSPSLFALPSAHGFSGIFPEPHNALITPSTVTDGNNKPNRIESQNLYLPRKPKDRKTPDQVSLQEAVPPMKRELPIPAPPPRSPVPQSKGISLFLSPELQARTDNPPQLRVPGTLPDSVRIHLGIRPDGTVDQVLFETPVENRALAGALRRLHFKPAAERTDGWLDLRFIPGEES